MSTDTDIVDPEQQYQIGDPVLYIPSGVKTKVTGYVWAESLGVPPRIALYTLGCGVSVHQSLIERRAP